MFGVCVLLFYVLTTTSASVGTGEGLPCGHCIKEWNGCLEAKCSGEKLKYSTHYTPGTCGWYCTSVKRRCFDDCNDANKDKLPKSTRNIIVKPARVPYIDTEDEGELLVHVSPSVWNKGEVIRSFVRVCWHVYRCQRGPISSWWVFPWIPSSSRD